MEVLPARQFRRDDLLRVPEFAAQFFGFFSGATDFFFFFFVEALAGFVEETEGPAGGAGEGVVGAFDGFARDVYGGDEGGGAGEGEEHGDDGGVD